LNSVSLTTLISLKLSKKIWLKPCRAQSALDKIQQKLKLLKQYFKGWGFNLQGELKKKKEEYQ